MQFVCVYIYRVFDNCGNNFHGQLQRTKLRRKVLKFYNLKFYNFNNEIFEISSIYIIRVICYMYWMCMRA